MADVIRQLFHVIVKGLVADLDHQAVDLGVGEQHPVLADAPKQLGVVSWPQLLALVGIQHVLYVYIQCSRAAAAGTVLFNSAVRFLIAFFNCADW